jgi:hypothetical protein
MGRSRERNKDGSINHTFHSQRSEGRQQPATRLRGRLRLRGAARTEPAEMACGRLKEPAPPVGRLGARPRRTFQIVEICSTNSAAHRPQVEFHIFRQRGLQRPQQKAPQLFSGRTTEPPAPPNFSHRVDPLVAAPRKGSDPQPQGFIAAEIPLDDGHAFGRQHLIEIGQQIQVRMCSRGSHLRDFSRPADCLPPPNLLGSINRLFVAGATPECGQGPGQPPVCGRRGLKFAPVLNPTLRRAESWPISFF